MNPTDELSGAPTVKDYEAFLKEELRDPELAAAYLAAAREDGSPDAVRLALRSVAGAQGGDDAAADERPADDASPAP